MYTGRGRGMGRRVGSPLQGASFGCRRPPLVSLESLDANGDEKKYVHVAWHLSDDGGELTVRTLNPEVIQPETDDAAKLIEANRENPFLLGETKEYKRDQ